MSSSKGTTKPSNLNTGFLRAASADPEGSLAYMLMAAFGVSLTQCMILVEQMIANKDVAVMLLCLTAGVQIRNNVVFVGPQYGNIRVKYPQLIIEGNRDVKDMFNFGACHICGHIIAEISSHGLGMKILQKAGSCVTGKYLTESDAGKINGEVYRSFSTTDQTIFAEWNNKLTAEDQEVVDKVLALVESKSVAFANALSATD
jgi:hypothetical protein